MAQDKVDESVFHTFFTENYCELDYSDVRSEFQEIAQRGLDALFTDEVSYEMITRKNFILYFRSSTYSEFEAIVEEVFDTINPEIADAVMDISVTMENQDEVTEVYWETCDKLLKDFLRQLFDETIVGMIAKEIQHADEL